MLGVIANSLGIIVGAAIGLLVKRLISEALSRHIQVGLGFCVLVIGMRMALQMQNIIFVIGCIVIGGALGFIWRIEERTNLLANKIQNLLYKNKQQAANTFAQGLTTTSILFCTGAMAVLGSIQSGMAANHEILFTKAAIDAVTSIPMAAIYGIGVAFSAIAVFVYQGGIAFIASFFTQQLSPEHLNDLSGVGGVLLLMTGCNLSGIMRVAVGDFMPAIVLVLLSLFIM